MTPKTCPICESNLVYTGTNGVEYSRVIGVEVPHVYDGVLYWRCPDCHYAWPRFRDGPRYTAAKFIILEKE